MFYLRFRIQGWYFDSPLRSISFDTWNDCIQRLPAETKKSIRFFCIQYIVRNDFRWWFGISCYMQRSANKSNDLHPFCFSLRRHNFPRKNCTVWNGQSHHNVMSLFVIVYLSEWRNVFKECFLILLCRTPQSSSRMHVAILHFCRKSHSYYIRKYLVLGLPHL